MNPDDVAGRLGVGGAYSLSPLSGTPNSRCPWARVCGKERRVTRHGRNKVGSLISFSSSERPCGTSPCACACRDPAPARRPSSTAKRRGTRSSPAPSGSRWATCPRWLCSGTSPLPGTGGRAGRAAPAYRAQDQSEHSLGTDLNHGTSVVRVKPLLLTPPTTELHKV